MTEPVLQLEKRQGFLRKISINTPTKKPDFTLFTLPIEGIPLTEQELDAFLGPYTFRAWYEHRKDDSWHPMPFWSRRNSGNFEVDGKLVSARVTVTIEGTDYLFEEYCVDEETDEEEPEGEARPAARISRIKLTPMAGGSTLLSFHMQVRALAGKARDALLDHMFRHIAITCDTEFTESKPAQPGLPLQDQTGHTSPPPIESKGDDQVDAELHARHPEASAEVMGADKQPDTATASGDGGMDPGLDADVKKFEADAQARIDEFKNRAANAVDGTTMRSRRRRRGEDTAH